MNKIGLMDVKLAMKDSRFRESLPPELTDDVVKYLHNPGCGPCGIQLFRKVLSSCKKQLEQYFPSREVVDEKEEVKKLAANNWTVINCKTHELEDQLRKLPPGRKMIAVARYEDEITVIIDELDVLF